MVVQVMRGRDLHDPGAKSAVNVVVCNHRDEPIAQRQSHVLAHQRSVAFVLGVHHHGHVTQHRFRPCCGHYHVATAVFQRVADVPQPAVFFLAFYFQVRHRAFQLGVPTHHALAAVDQALVVQAHKGFGDDGRELLVHREVLVRPADTVAHAAHLLRDGGARRCLPVPHLRNKIFAPQGMT